MRWLRDALGLTHIHQVLHRLEKAVASAAEQLNELRNLVTDAFADVTSKLDQLAAAQGELTPEAQEIFDDIKNRVSELDSRVGDADGSDQPTEPDDQQF